MPRNWKNAMHEVASTVREALNKLEDLPPIQSSKVRKHEEAYRDLAAQLSESAGVAIRVFDGTIEQRWLDEDSLYERYGQPLEAERPGAYSAVSRQGRVHVGEDLIDTLIKALAELGSGAYFLRVGDRAVSRWLWERQPHLPLALVIRAPSEATTEGSAD